MDRLRLLGVLTQKLENAMGEAADLAPILDSATAAELAELAELATGAHDYAVAEVLARVHWERYRLLLQPEDQRDLDGTIAWTPRLLPGIPRGDPYGTTLVLSLGAALVQRYARTGSVADLDLAIGFLEDEVNAVSGVGLAIVSYNVGVANRMRFGHSGQLADLESSVEWHRRAVAAVGEHPLRAQYLVDLAEVLHRHFDHVRCRAELDEAICMSQAALERPASRRPTRVEAWSVLGRALLSRAEGFGAAEDLRASVAALDAAVTESNADDQGHASRMRTLSEALRIRFELIGNVEDIDRAVATARAGAEVSQAGSVQQAGCLTALAMALVRRHDRTGALTDLAQAIEAAETATATFEEPGNRARAKSNLAMALRTRYGRAGSLADLDRAIDLLRDASEVRSLARVSRIV